MKGKWSFQKIIITISTSPITISSLPGTVLNISVDMNSYNPHDKPWGSFIIIPTFQMRKMDRQIKWFIQSHPASKLVQLQSDLNLGHPIPETMVVPKVEGTIGAKVRCACVKIGEHFYILEA